MDGLDRLYQSGSGFIGSRRAGGCEGRPAYLFAHAIGEWELAWTPYTSCSALGFFKPSLLARYAQILSAPAPDVVAYLMLAGVLYWDTVPPYRRRRRQTRQRSQLAGLITLLPLRSHIQYSSIQPATRPLARMLVMAAVHT